MAIQISSTDPATLLDSIRKAIDEERVRTWTYDEDGDFTHATAQWKNQAWLAPVLEGGELRLVIVAPKENNVSVETYAIYHGRFIEMLLAHFDGQFSAASATALPAFQDAV